MTHYDAIISNGTLVIPYHALIDGDVGVSSGRIAAIGQLGKDEADRRIDARGLLVFPGLVDPHVHIGNFFPYLQDLAQESRSAAAGGVTTFITTLRAGTFGTPPPRYADFFPALRDQFGNTSLVDFALHFTVPPGSEIDQVGPCYEQFGVQSFKFYTTYKERPIDPGLDDGRILELFEMVARMAEPPLLMVHAESDDIVRFKTAQARAAGLTGTVAWNAARPNIAEEVQLRTVMLLARHTGVRLYLPHVTTVEGAAAVREEMARGNRLIGETCAQYLTLTECSGDVIGKVNPPIRKQPDVEAIWAALLEGSITCVGTDHVAASSHLKQGDVWEARLAFPGMETLLPAVLTEALRRGLPPSLIAQTCAFNPSRAFGLAPHKGNLAVGADADLVIVDAQKRRTVRAAEFHSASKHSPWEGQSLTGWPVLTMLRGQVVYEDGDLVGEPRGQYRPVFPRRRSLS